MRQPTLFLTVGLPCTGKTTAARRIEIEQRALHLTKDEWVKALYGQENPSPAQDVIEGRLIQIGLRALELGNTVVIDYGLWGRDERSALRQAAADRRRPVTPRHRRPPILPAQTRRGQNGDGSHALPQTQTVQRSLSTDAHRCQGEPGRAPGGDSDIQRGRPNPDSRLFG